MPHANRVTPAGPSIDASLIPELETERLRLRAFALHDLPAACALWNDQAVVRFIGNTPRSEAEVWGAMARSFGQWALLGYGYWALADRQTNRYLGEIGFLEGVRDVKPSYVGTPEAGWALAQSAWGKGMATEALAAISAWADAHLSAEHTVCIIDPEHSASQRVAEKNGYALHQRAQLNKSSIFVYRRAKKAHPAGSLPTQT